MSANSMPVVIVLGSLNMDLVVRAPTLPRPGETLLGGPLLTYHGGKGANQAVAAARAGASVRMVGALGDDTYGPALRAGLKTEGIADTWVRNVPAEGSGVAVITVDERAENCIVVVPGANGSLSAQQVRDDFASGLGDDAVVLLAQLEVPIAAVVEGFRLARRAGLRTVLNAAPAPALSDVPAELLALTDILIVNETEYEALGPLVDQVGDVVVTLGSKGVRWRDTVVAPHRIIPVDTTGAGDAFCGAFVAELTRGGSMVEALGWGNAAGALAATKPGAQSSLPSAADISALLDARVVEGRMTWRDFGP